MRHAAKDSHTHSEPAPALSLAQGSADLILSGCKDHPHRTDLSCFKIRRADGTPLSVADTWEEIQRLRSGIDCAANALTDSILCSGNDAATNMHFVRKLKALLSSLNTQGLTDAENQPTKPNR